MLRSVGEHGCPVHILVSRVAGVKNFPRISDSTTTDFHSLW